MAITVKIGKGADKATVRLEMDIRKSLSGDLMIFDHGDIDIVLSSAQNKVVAFPKEAMNDLVYGAQNRLFNYLTKKGLVLPESIQAGAFFGSFEAQLQKPFNESLNSAKLTLVNINEFINEERPYFESTEAIISMSDDEMVHPDKEDSTELGEVPQRVSQGSIRPGYIRDPYSLNYMYTM
jgi:hypothetical protein|tara:strand:+ start:1069 stop:1608 length:540 start_codon:yes stop_codon:yes gene_type:complete